MNNSLGKDALILTSTKILTLLISMVTIMLLSRFRTLEEYGTYSQIQLIVHLVSVIFLMGLPSSINYFLARAESIAERQRFLSNYYTLSTIISFIIGLVLVSSVPLIINYFDNKLIRDFVYVLAVYPWSKIILSSIDNILVVYQKTRSLLLFKVLNSIFLLLSVALVEIFNWDFNTYMLLFVITETIFSFSVYVIVKKISGKIVFNLDLRLIKDITKFTLPLGFATILGTLKIELDKLVIAGFFNTERLAIYSNAAREMPVTIVSASLTSVLLPRVARLLKKGDIGKAVSMWGDTVSLSYLFMCFIVSGLFTYADEVMTFLYSEKYLPGVPVFRIYTLVLLFRTTFFGMILQSTGKTKFILYNSTMALIANVVMNFLLYYVFGFTGPALATLLATFLSATVLLLFTSKTIAISFKKIFPWRNIFIITMLNLLLSILFAWLKQIINLELIVGEVWESLILGLAWGAVYLLLTFNFIKDKWTSLARTDIV